MITEKDDRIEFNVSGKELLESAALIEQMIEFCEKHKKEDGSSDTIDALTCAKEIMMAFWCEYFGDYDDDETQASVLVYHKVNPDDESTLPDDDRKVLVSFANFSGIIIGRLDRDEDGAVWRVGDIDETMTEHGLIVDGWWELPEQKKGEGE